jgi:hypothetical protein
MEFSGGGDGGGGEGGGRGGIWFLLECLRISLCINNIFIQINEWSWANIFVMPCFNP